MKSAAMHRHSAREVVGGRGFAIHFQLVWCIMTTAGALLGYAVLINHRLHGADEPRTFQRSSPSINGDQEGQTATKARHAVGHQVGCGGSAA